jgi:hypothetical protein
MTSLLKHTIKVCFLTVVLPLLFAGCSRTINRTAERKVRDALPSYIGPAKVWRAHVDNPVERTLKGKLRNVTIDGEEVQLAEQIACETLHIELQDVVVDTKRQRLQSIGQATFLAVINEADLNDYLQRNPPPEEEPVRIKRVHLRKGAIQSEATRWLLGRAWPYTITAQPRLESATRLKFDPDRMTVLGHRVMLPASALRWLARRLDQGFDFSSLPFPVQISQFSVESGKIRLEGTADLLQSLNNRIEQQGPIR